MYAKKLIRTLIVSAACGLLLAACFMMGDDLETIRDKAWMDKPTAPTMFYEYGGSLYSDRIQIRWACPCPSDLSDTISYYQVYRANFYDGLFEPIGRTYDSSYDDTGLLGGTAYNYKVSTVLNSGAASPLSKVYSGRTSSQ